MALSIIILAAGQGTRMMSNRPKVLHNLAGKPMLQHVVDTSKSLNPEQIFVVVGYKSELVEDVMSGQLLHFIKQKDLLGTQGLGTEVVLPTRRRDHNISRRT